MFPERELESRVTRDTPGPSLAWVLEYPPVLARVAGESTSHYFTSSGP